MMINSSLPAADYVPSLPAAPPDLPRKQDNIERVEQQMDHRNRERGRERSRDRNQDWTAPQRLPDQERGGDWGDYGPPASAGTNRTPLKPLSFEQLDRPASPVYDKQNGTPGSPYDQAPPRPPLPSAINHGGCTLQGLTHCGQ